jgi:alanine dehydrogenase
MRADVTIMDIAPTKLAQLDGIFEGRARTVLSSRGTLLDLLPSADLVIGCVLITGAAAPKLITREDLKLMRDGSVLVDVAIDQGGCFETSRPTTHQEPTYVVDGVVHYCVANMPGAAPLTSTYALSAATTPYVLALADKGVDAAFAADSGFAAGLNIKAGMVTHAAVAEALRIGG